MNRYPAWKYILLIAVVAVSVLLALPNLYGEDPAIKITMQNGKPLPEDTVETVTQALDSASLPVKKMQAEKDSLLVRFGSTETQLEAKAVLKKELGSNYEVAINLVPSTPEWMQSIGLQPMNLGLDLQGGLHFLLQVDIKAAVQNALEDYRNDIQNWLVEALGPAQAAVRLKGDEIHIRFHNDNQRARAEEIIRNHLRQGIQLTPTNIKGDPALIAEIPDDRVAKLKSNAVSQNIAALRNRLNNLGVSEPLIQRQGQSQIVVELPGVQNVAKAKQSLHAKATIEFHLVDMKHSAFKAAKTGHIPLHSELYLNTPRGNPLLLKRDVIAAGKGLASASPAPDPRGAGWIVNVTLNSKAAASMLETTRKNYHKNMAVVLIKDQTTLSKVNGEVVRHHNVTKKVISNATIQGVFSDRFEISGMTKHQAVKLATQLKYALAVPMDIVGQRVVGPSLGAQNVRQGLQSLVLGFLAVVVFTALYYKVFGLIADLALFMNVVIIVALLSLLQATLTLPGIAGILLTVGMAVDANVLIYERIREELHNGSSPQAAIYAGYERAFSAIADANITTLIAGVVLFMFGSGPIKGFAITLSLGILSSLFTAIVGTRAVVNLVYGGRRIKKLQV